MAGQQKPHRDQSQAQPDGVPQRKTPGKPWLASHGAEGARRRTRGGRGSEGTRVSMNPRRGSRRPVGCLFDEGGPTPNDSRTGACRSSGR